MSEKTDYKYVNYLWDNVACFSGFCDGPAILLIMQLIMKVIHFFRLATFVQIPKTLQLHQYALHHHHATRSASF
jgi:hypothetical protein